MMTTFVILIGFLIGQIMGIILIVLFLVFALKNKWFEKFVDWIER